MNQDIKKEIQILSKKLTPLRCGVFCFIVFIRKHNTLYLFYMANGITYGINFPFRQSDVGDYLLLTQFSKDEIRANLIHLLLTRKGSRYYLPDFGTRLYEFIFEPLDGQTFETIKSDIEEQVGKYIPNLTINNITIQPYVETDEVVGQLDYELLGQASIYRIPGANTAEYTAKIKIDYTDESKAFGSREFVIINI